MPPASSRPLISLGELAVCEDLLDSNREYARDLVSSLEGLSRLHPTRSCLETREGRSCSLCELCGTDGLVGAAKKALEGFEDAEKRLRAIRATLGTNLLGHTTRSRETLLTNSLAKTLFFSIVTTGDALWSLHTTWKTCLKTEVARSPEECSSDLDTNMIRDMLSTHSGPMVVDPEMNAKLAVTSTGSVSDSSSMFVVFRRCLSPDCPCELNTANVACNTQARGVGPFQVASTDSPFLAHLKTHTYRRSEKTNDVSDATTETEANLSTRESNTHNDSNNSNARGSDTPSLQDAILATPAPLVPTAEAGSSRQELDSSSLIMDPRVSRLIMQITRCDDARRALMEWCRTRMATLQSDSWKVLASGPETSSTHGYPTALSLDIAITEPGAAGDIREVTTKDLACGNDETVTQDLWFDEQGKLARRWATARQKRCKDKTRCSSGHGR